MAGELPDINRIGQAALELPQVIASTEVAHLTEKMGTLGTEMEKLGTMLPMALPPLPGTEQLALPELPGMPTGAAREEVPKKAPASERKVTSYMEI